MKHLDGPEYLTTGQACRLLGCSRNTMIKLIKAKEIPAHTVGKQFRVERSVVETFRANKVVFKAATA